MTFDVDPDIRRARLPPARFYGDPAAYEAQRAAIFATGWHWLPDADDPEPGHAAPHTVLPGCVDAPIALVRDHRGALRALSNACTHRGMCVVTDAGPRRHLRCGYHGRQWHLDGRLRHAPGFEDALDFPSPSDDLAPWSRGALGPLRFAAHRPRTPFDAWIAPARELLAGLPLDAAVHDPRGDRDFDLDAPWALYVDNYLEGFHVPFVHPALNEALEIGRYRHALHPEGTVQIGAARPGEPTLALPAGHPLHGQDIAGLYVWLFPNLMINAYPWGVSVNLVMPRGPRATTVRYRAWVWDDRALGRGAGADVHQTEAEDDAMVEAVARGMRAPGLPRGRYAPHHEVGVHHFHRLCAARLRAEQAPPG